MLAPMVIPASSWHFDPDVHEHPRLFFENVIGGCEAAPARLLAHGLGQVSFISTFVALVGSPVAEVRPDPRRGGHEPRREPHRAIWHITLRYLRPALIGQRRCRLSDVFENFNTTLFLVGSESTIPITLYLQVRDGSTR